MTYTIEGWTGHLDCVGFSTRKTTRGAMDRATHFVVDLGADRVIVRLDGKIVGEVNEALHWQRISDPKITALLEVS